jgi:hypothetical protein
LAEGLLENTGIPAFEVDCSGAVTLRGAYHLSDEQVRAFTVNEGAFLVTDSNSIDLFDVTNSCDAGCIADLNGDGNFNFFDIVTFIHSFTEGNPSVDFNGDCSIDFFDVSAYVALYAAGCP